MEALQLQFHHEVSHKGSNNVIADTLYRLPVLDTEDVMIFKEEVLFIVCACLTQNDFKEATVHDPSPFYLLS